MKGLSFIIAVIMFVIFGLLIAVPAFLWAYNQYSAMIYSNCWRSVNDDLKALCLSDTGCLPGKKPLVLGACVSDVIFVNKDKLSGVATLFDLYNLRCEDAEAYVIIIPRKPGWWNIVTSRERVEAFKEKYFSKTICKRVKYRFNNIDNYLVLRGPENEGEKKIYCISVKKQQAVSGENFFEISVKTARSKDEC